MGPAADKLDSPFAAAGKDVAPTADHVPQESRSGKDSWLVVKVRARARAAGTHARVAALRHGPALLPRSPITRARTPQDSLLSQVSVSQAFTTLRDMVGDTLIPPSSLETVQVLGQGAYAEVEKAW